MVRLNLSRYMAQPPILRYTRREFPRHGGQSISVRFTNADWLDQARGLVVLLLIVSMSTAEFLSDMVLGDPVIGSPMLGHG